MKNISIFFMLKSLFAIIMLLNFLLVNAQNKGCGNPSVGSDHGGFCSTDTRLIDTAYFNIGDSVFFSYGTSGSTCDYISNNQIYFNGNAIVTPPPINTYGYFNTTLAGTYRFEWSQGINYNFTIELISNTTTSVVEIQKTNPINLFPNPTTSGNFTITLSQIDDKQNFIEVFNITGSLVLQDVLSGNSHSLDISSHPKGIYIVKVSNGQRSSVERLVYQ